MVCVPNVSDKGGQREFSAHYDREHASTPTPQRSVQSLFSRPEHGHILNRAT